MRELFRVVAYDPDARRGRPGHPATVIRSAQGGGRLDNPDLYATVYLSGSAAGSAAEVFGSYPTWRPDMLTAPQGGASARYALVRFHLSGGDVLDLDDPRALLERGLKPSRVVTTEREITQGWARTIYLEGRWTGAAWWSRWDARWQSCGVWESSGLSIDGRPELLTLGHEAIREAAEILNRPMVQSLSRSGD